MNETTKLVVILSSVGVMVVLFWVVFAMVMRYLISVFNLIRQVKEAEPELWTSLGNPTMFPVFHSSFNPFKGLFSQMRFCSWFLNGGEGAEAPETIAMVEKTKRRFRIAIIGLISIFVLYVVVFTAIGLMIATAGKG